MGSKASPGIYDCYANAEPDEPMFVLLGRDKHAPTLVWLWAVLRELDGEDKEKVAEARKCVHDMIEWNAKKGRLSAGVGEAALAAVLELIRCANTKVESIHEPGEVKNRKTDDDTIRRFLGKVDG